MDLANRSGCTSFGEFQTEEEKIAGNILAPSLHKLVHLAILEKTYDPDNKLKMHYLLADMGCELNSLMIVLGEWGHKHIDNTLDIVEKIKQLEKSGS